MKEKKLIVIGDIDLVVVVGKLRKVYQIEIVLVGFVKEFEEKKNEFKKEEVQKKNEFKKEEFKDQV